MPRQVYVDNVPREEALQRYFSRLEELSGLRPGQPQIVPVVESLGRVTAGPVYARLSSPHYHASAMDGVAVRSADTFGAAETTPVRLRLGEQGVVVDTGDPLPSGYDAVIMIEEINFVEPDLIEIIQPAVPWQHVRMIGEDVVATEMLLPANHLIRPYDLGALLAGGLTEVEVYPQPQVAIVPTGTEIVEPDRVVKPGEIIEFNSRVLAGLVTEWGGQPYRHEILRDDYAEIKQTISELVERFDVVVVNAGSSAGREDFTAEVIRELGEVVVHGVAIKPGKPVILGIVRNKPVVGLPGYPVSAVLTGELFVRPIIYRLRGHLAPERERVTAMVTRKTVSPLGVEEFVRVKLGQVGEKIVVTPLPRGAGLITSLVKADGVLRIPRFSEGFAAGEQVEVELLKPRAEVLNTTVIIGSHDLVLDVLASQLRQTHPEWSLSSAHVGSLSGLAALRRGEAHAAGIHLLDEATGEYNESYVRRMLPGEPVILLNLTYRQQGLLVAKGNPKGITGLADLKRGDLTFVNRQRGAGTRILLDYELRRLGIDVTTIRGYNREEFTHMAVAAAVASGTADAGLGILAAARALDLDFLPVAVERYDLCIPKRFWDSPYIQRLLDVINQPVFREQVERLGGYDLRDCGRVVWES
ncbi:MAG: molybdopterin biosynthesis protein [Firmicutes bacterium]|nr:molybdopterin biosynthesis protein [Bacillota bacterium]